MTTSLPTIQALTDEHGVTTHVVKFGKAMFVFESVALADQIKSELDAAVDAALKKVLHVAAEACRQFGRKDPKNKERAAAFEFTAGAVLSLAHSEHWRSE